MDAAKLIKRLEDRASILHDELSEAFAIKNILFEVYYTYNFII